MMIVLPISVFRFVFLADAGDDLSLLRSLSKTDLQLEQLLRLWDTFGSEDLRGLELNLHELVDGDLRRRRGLVLRGCGSGWRLVSL